MQDLAATTGENVHIAVLDGTRPCTSTGSPGRRAVPVVSMPAARLPLHATGVGKVLLANADPDVQRNA